MTHLKDVKENDNKNNRFATALAFMVLGGVICAAGWDYYETKKQKEHEQELRKLDNERNRQLNAKIFEDFYPR